MATSVAFEVLNGSSITTFTTIDAAIYFLDSIILERAKATLLMVTTLMHDGMMILNEELIEERHNLFEPKEWE